MGRLLLHRKPTQGVAIDGPCVVTVVHCRKSGRMMLAIEADNSVPIRRLELTKQVKRG